MNFTKLHASTTRANLEWECSQPKLLWVSSVVIITSQQWFLLDGKGNGLISFGCHDGDEGWGNGPKAVG